MITFSGKEDSTSSNVAYNLARASSPETASQLPSSHGEYDIFHGE